MASRIPTATPSQIDYRQLMADVDRVVNSLEGEEENAPTVQRLANALTRSFARELGLTGGRLYIQQGDEYRVWATFGDAKPVEKGVRVSKDYPPVVSSIAAGTLYMEEEDPLLDRDFEDRIGSYCFAVIVLGEREYLLAFDVASDHEPDQVMFALGLLRHSINQKIQQQQVQDVLREARSIQAAILPRERPQFPGYDIFGKTVPLDTVGGDFYDSITITDKILGLAIADVSGHGLPAALQVRDIYMGLRMGMSRDFKIVRTVERMNQIIHQSRSTSRFVSMFYGELEADGTLIYVNAGHPPPILLTAEGKRRELSVGGVVLGPLPNATYNRGVLQLEHGDILIAFTDGIVETVPAAANRPREDESGDSAAGSRYAAEYGVERLVATCLRLREESAEAIVEGLFEDLDRFSGGAPANDDRTLGIVKYSGTPVS